MGHCGEKICITFPKAPEEQVKELMDMFPKGFNGFDRETGEKALRCIAGLKADCWKLRRSYVMYPEFCKEVMEGLPVPEDFNGFNMEESKEIVGVIVALMNAQSRLKNIFQPFVQEAKSFPCSQHQATTQVPCPQYQASTPVTGPVHYNVPLYPDHCQFFPYQCPPTIFPFGMAPTAWNPYYANYAPPYMSNHSGMP